MKKVLVACGGSLGHINPGFSIIKELKNDYTCYLLTTEIDYNKFLGLRNNSLIKEVFKIDVKGLNRKNILQMLLMILKYIKTIFHIISLINQIKPNLIVSTGGFVGGLASICAIIKKIPFVIHEQNACFGLANKLFHKKAKIVLTSFQMNCNNEYLIGNPRIIEASDLKNKIVKPSLNRILVLSGSLGAKSINNLMIDYLKNDNEHKYYFTVVTGTKYYDEVVEQLGNIENNYFKIIPFLDNPLIEMAKSNLIISRSGATTLFEIIGLNIPTILIPSPNVTNNHQYKNAQILKECILEEKDMNIERVDQMIKSMINSEKIINKLNNISDEYLNKMKDVQWMKLLD